MITLLVYLMIFALPVVLPIFIVKLLWLFSKNKKDYYYEYDSKCDSEELDEPEEFDEDEFEDEDDEPVFINVTKCPYCDSENSWNGSECKNCGAREVSRIRKEVTYTNGYSNY